MPVSTKQRALPQPYLRHELVGDRVVFVELDAVGRQCPLQEESQRQLGQLRLDERLNRLVAEREDLAAFLLPLVVLPTSDDSNHFNEHTASRYII